MEVKAYLEITMKIDSANRPAAAKVYSDYRIPFLDTIAGALTKNLLVRDEDVQVFSLSEKPAFQRRCGEGASAFVECRSRSAHLHSCLRASLTFFLAWGPGKKFSLWPLSFLSS